MNHYKSWAGLNKQLTDLLCEELKDHLSYFLTRYHRVHNSYGRAPFVWIRRNWSAFHGLRCIVRKPTCIRFGKRPVYRITTI